MEKALNSNKSVGRRSVLVGLSAFLSCASNPAIADAPPLRVASLDWALAETMLVLGKTPLAVVAASDWARFVVEPALPPTTADLGLQQEINFELLAQLRPDLVLISPFLQHKAPQIERIAETLSLSVFEEEGAPLTRRQSVTRQLGARLGADVQAAAYLAKAEAMFERLARRAAALPPRPILLVTFVDARHVRVYAGSSMFQTVLNRLGLQNAWADSVGYFGFDTVGIERLATVDDLHLVMFDPVPADLPPRLARSPLWTELPFVKARRISTLPPVLMFGGMPAATRFAQLLVEALEEQV